MIAAVLIIAGLLVGLLSTAFAFGAGTRREKEDWDAVKAGVFFTFGTFATSTTLLIAGGSLL